MGGPRGPQTNTAYWFCTWLPAVTRYEDPAVVTLDTGNKTITQTKPTKQTQMQPRPDQETHSFLVNLHSIVKQ